jgi:hypothetical protein
MYTPKEFDRVVIHATGETGMVEDITWSGGVPAVYVRLDNCAGRVAVYAEYDLGPLIREETRP